MEEEFKKIYLKNIIKSIATICFVAMLFSCENDIKKVSFYTKPDDVSLETAEKVEITYSEVGKTMARLKAPLMNRYGGDKPRMEMPKGVEVLFFDSLQKVESKLTANYAIRYEKEQKMEGKNNVVIVNRKGHILNTEHLVWDEKKEKIYSDIFVKITTPDEILFGDGFESDQYFDHYEIKKLRGTISLKE